MWVPLKFIGIMVGLPSWIFSTHAFITLNYHRYQWLVWMIFSEPKFKMYRDHKSKYTWLTSLLSHLGKQRQNKWTPVTNKGVIFCEISLGAICLKSLYQFVLIYCHCPHQSLQSSSTINQKISSMLWKCNPIHKSFHDWKNYCCHLLVHIWIHRS